MTCPFDRLSGVLLYLMMTLFLAVVVSMGCAFYSFSGGLPPHIKTVAIPLFEDRTSEFGIKEELTDALVEEFTRDNSLKIADEREADSVIRGSILSVDDRAGAFDKEERVQELKVYVTVQVKYEDLKKRKVLWEERISQWGVYDPNLGVDGRREAITEAIGKLSADILNKTVAGW